METTPRCRIALDYAQESLARFSHAHISSAHLILGLLTLQGGVAANILRQSGLSVQSVEGYLVTRRTSEEVSSTQEGRVFGRSALLALEQAEVQACAQRFTYLGVEHLLLGILAEESGAASDLFASVHIDRETMRRTIQQEIQ